MLRTKIIEIEKIIKSKWNNVDRILKYNDKITNVK